MYIDTYLLDILEKKRRGTEPILNCKPAFIIREECNEKFSFGTSAYLIFENRRIEVSRTK